MRNRVFFETITGSLTNKCLVAMPNISDNRFKEAVIYICSNSSKTGSVGLVLNKKSSVSLFDVLEQLQIFPKKELDLPILWGGPCETIRGFVLHSNDFRGEETVALSDSVSLTTSDDVLTALSEYRMPRQALVFLGYSLWGAGQLELEIAGNSWLVLDVDANFLFSCPFEQKKEKAFSLLGINPNLLSLDQGSV